MDEALSKLSITKLTESDRSQVFDLLQNAESMRFLGNKMPMTDKEAETWFSNELKAETRFAFRHTDSQELVGFCGIKLIDGQLDFGYFLRRKFWGQGFAVLMCKQAIQNLAATTDLNQVRVFIANDNTRSQKVAKKMGWQKHCTATDKGEPGHLYLICT